MMDYRFAGVDIDKGDRIALRVREMLGAAGARLGHFGGALPLPGEGAGRRLLVSSIDGVGTKSLVATAQGRNDTSGRDLVHHCINDIAVCGAEPVGFLDYIAMGSLDEEVVTAVLKGLVDACRRWGVTLLGGETAEMPDVYLPGVYDLAGVIYGIAAEADFIDGRTISAGDILLGFPSIGLHTNGFTLARRVFETAGVSYTAQMDELGTTVGDALLAEHRCYLSEIRTLRRDYRVKGLAHITGGGLEGNTRRIMPDGLQARFDWGSWEEPPIFGVIRKLGSISEADMRRTFNLGVGLVAVLDPEEAARLQAGFPPELLNPVPVGVVEPL